MLTLEDKKTEKRCYGCGQFGHLRGDASCTAGKDDIWGGAPKAYLDKVQKRFGLTPNGSKRQASSMTKQICPYWSSGDGYCKYAERCKFEHSGPQGGSKRGREFGSKGKGKDRPPPANMPKELEGLRTRTRNGKPICWGANMPEGCSHAKWGQECYKGLHVCMKCGSHHAATAGKCQSSN